MNLNSDSKILEKKAVSACALYQRAGKESRKWCELILRHVGLVYYRKLSKEWSCSILVTSQPISAQPCGPRSTAIYKIPLWPSLRQGWMPILKSTICSSVHILEVPRDYVTALQAWPLSKTILLADDNAAANQLSGPSQSHERTSPDHMVQLLPDKPWQPAVWALKWDNSAGVLASQETLRAIALPVQSVEEALDTKPALVNSFLSIPRRMLASHSYIQGSLCLCDSAKRKTPTQDYPAVALVKGDYMRLCNNNSI